MPAEEARPASVRREKESGDAALTGGDRTEKEIAPVTERSEQRGEDKSLLRNPTWRIDRRERDHLARKEERARGKVGVEVEPEADLAQREASESIVRGGARKGEERGGSESKGAGRGEEERAGAGRAGHDDNSLAKPEKAESRRTMGMDVYGKQAACEQGEYFRNNVWWWRPLAQYVCEVAPAITSRCEYWQSNDGDGLNAKDSLALAEALEIEIDSGRTAEYALKYLTEIEALPRIDCAFCYGTGIRTDSVGMANGMPERIVTAEDNEDEDNNLRVGKRGWCNACRGSGTVKQHNAYYPFSVDNVREFVVFLKNCGGFKIC